MFKRIALRMDDVGASSKQFEIYGKNFFYLKNKRILIPSFVTNFLLLKRIPLWSGNAPYKELNEGDWKEIIELLCKYSAKLTVGITASWVEKDGSLIPFHEKFPDAAKIIKKALDSDLIEIANHGLTHCVVGKHMPHLFSSNRKFHREFWDWLPEEVHFEHVSGSQRILQKYFETRVTTLVPPGNVFSISTLEAARNNGIDLVNCQTNSRTTNGVRIIGNENVLAFHDRDIALYGTGWLRKKLELLAHESEFLFVKEL